MRAAFGRRVCVTAARAAGPQSAQRHVGSVGMCWRRFAKSRVVWSAGSLAIRDPAVPQAGRTSPDTHFSASLYTPAPKSRKATLHSRGRSSGFWITRICRPSQPRSGQWHRSAVRPQLQRRARAGFSPASRSSSPTYSAPAMRSSRNPREMSDDADCLRDAETTATRRAPPSSLVSAQHRPAILIMQAARPPA